MADTTTPVYGYTSPEVGASDDTWGTKLNANWLKTDNLLGGTTPITGIDINSGTVDNAVIGGAVPAGGTFTGLVATTVDINGGTLDATQIGASAASTVVGTTITGANFVGPLAGAVTGNVTGNTAGVHTGAVTGDVTGNITAGSGTSTFNHVTIGGSLDMDAGTSATITGLSTPVQASDAATKSYVDTAVANLIDNAPANLDTLNELAAALGDDEAFATTIAASVATKLPKAGGTMSGAIAMGTNKITGLGTPTAGTDAATKAYADSVDTQKLDKSGGTMSGVLAMGANKITGVADPTQAQDASTKNYTDVLFGSTAAAATSAANAATSEGNASTSATAASNSATSASASFDSFDDRYLGSKASAPSTDNQGNALILGAQYYNATSGKSQVWNGSSWQDVAPIVTGDYLLKSGGAMTGAITTNSTFDGRDVATDGTKLDGIATSANNYILPSTLPASMLTGALPAISGAALTNLPAGGNSADFVASGTLPNGVPVVLKSNGTIEAVVATPTTIPESIPSGSEAVYNSQNAWMNSMAYDPNTAGKFVVAYKDMGNGAKGTVVVGTVSGTSISFGSEIIFNAGSTSSVSVDFDPNTAGMLVFTYRDSSNSSRGTAVVGTITGTSITFGSEIIFNSGTTIETAISFDPNNAGKFVVAYQDGSNSNYGSAIVGTVSGTSITFGSEFVFNAASTSYISVSCDPSTADKFIVVCKNSTSTYGIAKVGTVSGTSISFGSEAVYNSASTSYINVAFDPNTAGKFVVAYSDAGNSTYGTVVVGTISGTSATFGSEVVYNSGTSLYSSISFDPNTAGKFVVAYKDMSNSSYGTVIVGTISGTSATFGSENVLSSATTNYTVVAFDPNKGGEFVVAYDVSSNGRAILGQMGTVRPETNLTSTNFAGTSAAAFTNGQTATIALQGGISTNQSGLTIGATYYVQGDATLATTADTPSVIAGKAVSATTLLIKGI